MRSKSFSHIFPIALGSFVATEEVVDHRTFEESRLEILQLIYRILSSEKISFLAKYSNLLPEYKKYTMVILL